MPRIPLSLATCVWLAGATLTAADVPSDLFAEALLLPPDASVLIGLDVHALFASATYSQLMSGKLSTQPLPPDKAAETAGRVKAEIDKALNEAEGDLGFRFDRDIDRLAIAVRSKAEGEPEILGVVLGQFDRARVLAAMEASEKKASRTLRKEIVEGVSVYWVNPPTGPGVAFLDRGLVFGDMSLVRAALAAKAAHQRPLEKNVALVSQLRGVKLGGGLFVLVGPSAFQQLGQDPKSRPPFPIPTSLSLTSRFDGPLGLTLAMQNDAEARNLADFIRGGLALLRMRAASDPDLQKIPGLQDLGTSLAVTNEGATVSVATAGSSSLGTLVGVAAVAIPSLLRARASANEAAALGDLRTVISAEVTYQSANQGFYGDLTCLSEPATCIKGYTGSVFLDKAIASLQPKAGYQRSFFPGPAAMPKSLKGFAYTAVPSQQGSTGTRSFCGDWSGMIRVDPNGGEIKPVNGDCPRTLQPLR